MLPLFQPGSVHPFDWVEDVIFILDAHERLTFVNAFALNAWEKESHELLGRGYQDALPTKAQPEVMAAFRHVLSTQQRTELEVLGDRHQGWIGLIIYPNQGGLIVHVRPLPRSTGTTTHTDFDALTGCLTRIAFVRAQRTLIFPHVLAILDLNLLKSVNTLRGHSGGDAHIRTVAFALREALPAEALICRWGGDEFVILMPGHDQTALQELLDETNSALPGPIPDILAFTVGLTIWEADTAYERAFAIADEQLQLRKELLREAVPGQREADSFVTFSQELEALQDPGDLIQHSLNRLLNLLNFDQAAYAIIDGDEAFFSHQALREGVPAPQPALNVRVPLAETGLVDTVHRTRTTAWSTDYPSILDSMPSVIAQGVKSGLVTPVFSHGQVVAAIILRTVNRWQTITPQMRKIVELTALRLEHALELRRAVSEVRSILEAGMLTLGLVLETRDFGNSGHTHRAAMMAARLGEHLGLNTTDLHYLRKGAYLHDLGKLYVPDELLRKPGRLTQEEWAVMQSHVVQGHDLATRIAGLSAQTLDVIRSHHERWDGSGYPDGLTGTDIPLNARIFAVCDVYDALISERPYKDAWSHESTVLEIERQSGQHFDPDVVRAFLSLMEENE
ncbi:HD domain-containing protein [Deinococcus psychrotolerans]|uniref:HD domain-containing protein n=1 Tax=Deinococcus psychrotolerans TaxID=2489213 RepID=A0A3G8YSM9_9DEIO|nr:HD domain-containing phosphohydrolase [Deinococcus psychrotolerans]AZI44236.1 HD domain-containing protein [Deinococcus psychrotolerans]